MSIARSIGASDWRFAVGLVVCVCQGLALGPLMAQTGDPDIDDINIVEAEIGEHAIAAYASRNCGNFTSPSPWCPFTGANASASNESCTTCSDPPTDILPLDNKYPERMYPNFTTEGSGPNGPTFGGNYNSGNSIIHNLTFNYIHFADGL